MAELTINIPDEEIMYLKSLAKVQNTTETEIIREALKRFFKENFIDNQTIILSKKQYLALAELIDKSLSENEIEGRKRLEKVSDWEL